LPRLLRLRNGLPATGFSIELPRHGVPVLAGFAVRLTDAKTPPFGRRQTADKPLGFAGVF
jgi:hypothetical protein